MMKNSIVVVLVMFVNAGFAQIDPVDVNGLALGGYDVVAYFKDSKATKGDEKFASDLKGVKYFFANASHKKSFDENPEAFLPQYEGYCALAVATTAKKISINPELFKITDGKLYLFYLGKLYSGDIFNSIEPWLKTEQTMIKNADANWPKVKVKKYSLKK